ncbi:hypothetical protein PPL_00305 [Heterostelium album PN500]|uniref:Uncharacterized protein n=1 Tax=Heterostelium pallidum (strain ATCC 26659 / Pp 5 / PN500) TaxID=670386 RepID=D3AW37_HETP5|nr:hypothetical protein PPL_00305 [Heterostelium album PN500]EFA86510.1 hypothetical protein PPL_00305 [Heterostelium album PN500]|eukprot:XP_020438615.1 hypothetical protein PPL_00305 [Heterostelium album PN500]
MAAYFLKRFIAFNALKVSTIRCADNRWKAPTLLDLAVVGIDDVSQAFLVSDELMNQLQSYVEHPVMYCLDEHQHLWKDGVENSSFGKAFTIEAGPCSGARTILVVSGSAHSKFEHNLPSGMSSWIHRVLPFSEASFKQVIEDEKSGLHIREDWRDDQDAIDRLAEITGRIPREIQEMHDQMYIFSTPESFLDSRKKLYTDEINKYITDSDHDRREDYYRFLDVFFSRVDKMDILTAPSTLCDTGLVFFDSRDNVYHSICRGAFLALHNSYWMFRGFPTMASLGDTALGSQFQTLVERAFKIRSFSEPIRGFHLVSSPQKPKKGRSKKTEQPKFAPIDIPLPLIGRTVYIKKRDHKLEVPRHYGMNTLYIPSAGNFPSWDFIIYNPTTNSIFFIQTSLSTIQAYETSSPMAQSFNTTDVKNIASITESITGKTCVAQIDGSEMRLVSEGLKSYFIYITWSSLEQQRPEFNNLIIFDKSVCHTLNIHLDQLSNVYINFISSKPSLMSCLNVISHRPPSANQCVQNKFVVQSASPHIMIFNPLKYHLHSHS